MKIKMMTLAAVFCCALSSTMFTACGSDDDDDKVQVDDTKPVGALMNYGFDVNKEMLDAFDFTVEYYDENCQLQTEKLTQEKWKKSVKVAKLPVSLGCRLKAKVKDGIDANFFRKNNCLYGFAYDGILVNAAGNSLTNGNYYIHDAGIGARFQFEEKEFNSFLSQEDDVIISVRDEFSSSTIQGSAWWVGKSFLK